MNAGGQTIKLVCRYQQYGAVTQAIARLKSGKKREEDGEYDRRGGIIWHTQGRGKSLTMVFMVRKLRTDPALRRFKVVVITDRKDLQRQLSETADLTDETVHVAANTGKLKALVARPGPGLVFGTIQKYREAGCEDVVPGRLAQAAEPERSAYRSQAVAAAAILQATTTHASAPLQHENNVTALDVALRPPRFSQPFERLNDSPDILVMIDEAHR